MQLAGTYVGQLTVYSCRHAIVRLKSGDKSIALSCHAKPGTYLLPSPKGKQKKGKHRRHDPLSPGTCSVMMKTASPFLTSLVPARDMPCGLPLCALTGYHQSAWRRRAAGIASSASCSASSSRSTRLYTRCRALAPQMKSRCSYFSSSCEYTTDPGGSANFNSATSAGVASRSCPPVGVWVGGRRARWPQACDQHGELHARMLHQNAPSWPTLHQLWQRLDARGNTRRYPCPGAQCPASHTRGAPCSRPGAPRSHASSHAMCPAAAPT
jgi:hypothetical protein